MTALNAIGPEAGEARNAFVTYQQKLASDLATKAAEKAGDADKQAVAEAEQAAHQNQQAYQAQRLAQIQQQTLAGGALTGSFGPSLDVTV